MSIRRFAVRGHCKLIFYQINQIFQKLDDFAIKSIVLHQVLMMVEINLSIFLINAGDFCVTLS